MRQAKMLWIALSAFMVSGCASVDRPDSPMCILNTGALRETCANLKKDYDDNGNFKKDAKLVITQYKSAEEMLLALNKRVATTPEGWANIKTYIRELRAIEKEAYAADQR